MAKILYGRTISIDVYEEDVVILWGDKALAIKCCEKRGHTFNERVRESVIDGFCVQINEKSYVYIGECLKNYNTIVHELTHAILNMTHRRGIVVDDTPYNQETTTYLFGYVMGTVLGWKKEDWSIWNEKRDKWNK